MVTTCSIKYELLFCISMYFTAMSPWVLLFAVIFSAAAYFNVIFINELTIVYIAAISFLIYFALFSKTTTVSLIEYVSSDVEVKYMSVGNINKI